MSIPPPAAPHATRINPWLSLSILTAVAGIAWFFVARNAAPPNTDILPPIQESPRQDTTIVKQKLLLGTITYVQDTNLTTLLKREDNPILISENRVLIVAYHRATRITDRNGNEVDPSLLKAGDRIAVRSTDTFSEKEPVLFADTIVLNPAL